MITTLHLWYLPDQYYGYQYDHWTAKAIIDLLNRLEKPVLDNFKSRYKRILLSLFGYVDPDYIQSFTNRVLIILQTEKKIVQSGIDQEIEAIVATNTSLVTQDACDILVYELEATIPLCGCLNPATKINSFETLNNAESVKVFIKNFVGVYQSRH